MGWLVAPLEIALVTFVASFVNGVLGAGGAILFVPLALYLLPPFGTRLEPHAVTSLSLVQGVCALLAGAAVYGRRGQVDRRHLWLGGPPLVAGSLAGGVLSAVVPGRVLVLLFAFVVTAAAALLFLPPVEATPRRGPTRVLAAVTFLAIGVIGGAVGVGAGVLVIPVLIYLLGTPQRVATGTGLVLPALISGPAFAGKAVSGQVPWVLVPAVVVAALAGVLVGARLHAAISETALRLGLSGLTAALAVTVWARLLTGG